MKSVEEFENCMAWLVSATSALSSGYETWTRSRKHLANLACFHGYVPHGFTWEHSEVVKFDLVHAAADNARVVAADSNGRTTNFL